MNTYTEENRNFYRAMPDYDKSGIQRVSISSPDVSEQDTGIRLYCSSWKQTWELQIRGFFKDRNYRKGKKWYLADASLGVDELRSLRDACDAALKECQ